MTGTGTKWWPFRPRRLGACRPIIAAIFVFQLLVDVRATEFRVESLVYTDDSQQPYQHRVALFSEKATYDLALASSRRVTILLPEEETLVVIDTIKREYARVSRNDLGRLIAEQQKRINKMSLDHQAILNPRLQEAWDPHSRTLSLSSSHLTYVAKVVSESPEIVQRYQEFADWHARLNAIMPGSPSPTPRLGLNKAIAGRVAVPAELTKTHIWGAKNTLRLRSEHLYESRWREDDRRRVKQILATYPAYQEIELFQFLRIAAADEAARQ